MPKEELPAVVPPQLLSPEPLPPQLEELVAPESVVELYGEVLDNLRADRHEIQGLVDNFSDMACNDTDGSPETKEALVQLLNVKNAVNDKMLKLAEMMTNLKKTKAPKAVVASQHNTYNFSANKRDWIEKLRDTNE